MMNEQTTNSQRRSASPDNPRQFRIIDLFALITLAALLSAMAAPFVQSMTPANRTRLLVVVACQLLVTGAAIAYSAITRAKLLDESGRRIGIGYSGTVKWRHWPMFKSIASMTLLAVAQLAISLMYAFASVRDIQAADFFVFQLQLGFFTGMTLSRYKWQVYPGAVEFFDNGMSFGGTHFIGWDQSEIRPSAYLPDRIVIVVRREKGSIAGETRTAQVSELLRDKLVAITSTSTST